jgi:hypothetical protein
MTICDTIESPRNLINKWLDIFPSWQILISNYNTLQALKTGQTHCHEGRTMTMEKGIMSK